MESGQLISSATRILRDTSREIDTLFADIDSRMSERKLYPSRTRTLNKDAPIKLQRSDAWIVDTFYRSYTESRDKDGPPRDRLLLFELHLTPQGPDEPILAAAALRLSEPQPPSAVWDLWRTMWPTVADSIGRDEPRDMPAGAFQRVFPNVAASRGFYVPLTSLRYDNLETRFVAPAANMLLTL